MLYLVGNLSYSLVRLLQFHYDVRRSSWNSLELYRKSLIELVTTNNGGKILKSSSLSAVQISTTKRGYLVIP